MAKKNVRDDPSKTQVTENPQMSDIVLVLDKMELLIQAVSEINKNGKYSTVPADKEHQNSFLKIDRYATFFENFLKNFWSQLKDPTHFGLFTMKEEEFDKPEVKQAIEDLAEGKKTKAVEEFLKKYEITPKNQTKQSINNQNSEEMAITLYNCSSSISASSSAVYREVESASSRSASVASASAFSTLPSMSSFSKVDVAFA